MDWLNHIVSNSISLCFPWNLSSLVLSLLRFLSHRLLDVIESFIIHDEYYSDMLCAFVACTIEMQTKRAKGWSLMSDFGNIPLKEFIALSLDIGVLSVFTWQGLPAGVWLLRSRPLGRDELEQFLSQQDWPYKRDFSVCLSCCSRGVIMRR